MSSLPFFFYHAHIVIYTYSIYCVSTHTHSHTRTYTQVMPRGRENLPSLQRWRTALVTFTAVMLFSTAFIHPLTSGTGTCDNASHTHTHTYTHTVNVHRCIDANKKRWHAGNVVCYLWLLHCQSYGLLLCSVCLCLIYIKCMETFFIVNNKCQFQL